MLESNGDGSTTVSMTVEPDSTVEGEVINQALVSIDGNAVTDGDPSNDGDSANVIVRILWGTTTGTA